jgi:DNA-binding PadR family transcriptional regulator
MILLAVLRVGEDAYAVPVAREIETTAGRAVTLASVYVALERLEARGLVGSSVGEPTPERGGRAKRFFQVTPKGLRSIRETQRSLVALWEGLTQLAGGKA